MLSEWAPDRVTVSTVAIGIGLLVYLLYKKLQRSAISLPPEAVAVGTVHKLLLYPVKSLVAITELDDVRAVKEGFITNDSDGIRDRAWMIVSNTGVFLSQRAEPKLAHLRPSIPFNGDMLHIDGPDTTTLKVSRYITSRTNDVTNVSVWGHHLDAVDCGQEAANWISAYLGRSGFRMVFLPQDMAPRTCLESGNKLDRFFEKDDKTIFADAGPILLLSENSVKDIDNRTKDNSITVRNFRPNIVVSGSDAWDEDNWDEIYVGQVKMVNKRQCDRCSLTTVDPDKGAKHANSEPLVTLRTFRKGEGTSPFVGIYVNVAEEGLIAVGDTVYVTRKSS